MEEYFGAEVSYVEQAELKGTAHLAYVGMQKLPNSAETVLVINGDDSAFYSDATILDFGTAQQKQRLASVLSVELADPSLYGRIVKHDDGRIEIIEKEYLTDEQKRS